MKNCREGVAYLIVGGLTTLISLAVYHLLVMSVLDAYNPVELQIANAAGWTAGVLFAYAANRKYVFQSHNPNRLQEAGRFIGARVSTLLLDMGMMFVLVTMLGYNDRMMKLIVQAAVIIANYVISKWFVFTQARRLS